MSLEQVFSEKSLERISSKLVEIAFAPDVNKLAKLALEVIISRENVREVLKGDYPKGLKEKAEKTLSKLEELEKRIVQIYGFGVLAEAKWARHPITTRVIGKMRRKEETGAVVTSYERGS